MSIRSTENLVAIELSSDQLTDNVSVGKTDDESVLRGAVLVLRLGNKLSSCEVVGLALTAAFCLLTVSEESHSLT